MRWKYENTKPDLMGRIGIRYENGIYYLFCNGKYVTYYSDFMQLMNKIKNGIYGYDKEITEY